MNGRSNKQNRHAKPLVEVVVAVVGEANTRMTVAIGSATRTNPMEEIIMEKVITLETVFKRD